MLLKLIRGLKRRDYRVHIYFSRNEDMQHETHIISDVTFTVLKKRIRKLSRAIEYDKWAVIEDIQIEEFTY